MKHKIIKELLPLYIDGGLDKDEREEIKAHLKGCQECRQELKEYQENFNYLSNLQEESPPDNFLELTIERVKNEERGNNEIVKDSGLEGWFEKILEILRRKVRIPVGGIFVTAVLVLAVILIVPLSQHPGNQLQSPGNLKQNNLYNAPDNRMKSFEKSQISQQVSPQGTDSVDSMERKVIHTANLQIEVDNIDKFGDKIIELVQKANGLISNSRQWKSSTGRRYLNYQLRILDIKFYQIIDELETYGEVTSRSLSDRDVTKEYIDVNTRLKNMQAQEDKYRQLLNQAEKVEDVLKIEKELERVRTNIESMQNRLKYLNDQVNLSTINVQLSEPEPIIDSNSSLIKAIRQAVKRMGDSFYQMIIYLGVWLPYLILIAAVYIIYRIKKRSN